MEESTNEMIQFGGASMLEVDTKYNDENMLK
jgi:hypothetical protein